MWSWFPLTSEIEHQTFSVRSCWRAQARCTKANQNAGFLLTSRSRCFLRVSQGSSRASTLSFCWSWCYRWCSPFCTPRGCSSFCLQCCWNRCSCSAVSRPPCFLTSSFCAAWAARSLWPCFCIRYLPLSIKSWGFPHSILFSFDFPFLFVILIRSLDFWFSKCRAMWSLAGLKIICLFWVVCSFFDDLESSTVVICTHDLPLSFGCIILKHWHELICCAFDCKYHSISELDNYQFEQTYHDCLQSCLNKKIINLILNTIYFNL